MKLIDRIYTAAFRVDEASRLARQAQSQFQQDEAARHRRSQAEFALGGQIEPSITDHHAVYVPEWAVPLTRRGMT